MQRYTKMVGNDQPLSLYDTSEYSDLPHCAQIPLIKGSDSLDCHTNNCFCRPDLMKHAMHDVSSFASHACSGVAPAGVRSALAVIVNYCSRNGFAATTTYRDEVTGTASIPPQSSAVLPGASAPANLNICMMSLMAIFSRCFF